MGYRISYQTDKTKSRRTSDCQSTATAFGIFLLFSAVAFRLLEPEGSQRFRDLILPNIASVIAFVENSELSQSVYAFCQDVLCEIYGS